jgi:glutathione S-transferase
MGETKLITFGISHYCEKARWALDWHGIPYVEIRWPPGVHKKLARRCGAKATTLPILIDDGEAIQDSRAILDWAEARSNSAGRSLIPPRENRAEAEEIERRANAIIGMHVRRLIYAETLPKHSHLVKASLLGSTSGWQRIAGEAIWQATWRAMMETYDVRPGAADESRSILEAEFDWLGAKLSDKRRYVVGDRFSCADLTIASLLSGFARPDEWPVARDLPFTPALTAEAERWQNRHVMQFVRTLYRLHRLRKAEEIELLKDRVAEAPPRPDHHSALSGSEGGSRISQARPK